MVTPFIAVNIAEDFGQTHMEANGSGRFVVWKVRQRVKPGSLSGDLKMLLVHELKVRSTLKRAF